jgi:uncharacterized protein YraI
VWLAMIAKSLIFASTGIAALLGCGVAFAQNTCANPQGDYIVIEVHWDDPIGGLAIRTGPGSGFRLVRSNPPSVIPSNGTDIQICQCRSSGWCEVQYGDWGGWSFLAKYLAPRTRRLSRVIDVRSDDPDGLNMRTGPYHTYERKGRIPYNATGVIRHVCQPSPRDSATEWCLVTYAGNSGWVNGQYLAPQPTEDPPPPARPQTVSPQGPRSDPHSRACEMFPNLCDY